MKRWMVTLAGIALFATAFFLPAVRSPGTGAGSGPITGWFCAMIAASATGGIFRASAANIQAKDMLHVGCLILSGWVNPLVLFYLVVSFWRRLATLRRVLGAAILLCLVATWVFLYKEPMIPLIGHYMWAAGALLILVGEVFDESSFQGNSREPPRS